MAENILYFFVVLKIQPSPLCQTEDTLTEIIALVHSVKQKTSLPEQEKDAKPRPKHKKLRKNKPESAGQEARNIQSDGLQQKPSETQTQEKGAERMAGTLVLSGSPTAAENIRQMEVHEKSQDITPVSVMGSGATRFNLLKVNLTHLWQRGVSTAISQDRFMEPPCKKAVYFWIP